MLDIYVEDLLRHTHTGRQTHRQADRQTDRHTDRQTDRQTDFKFIKTLFENLKLESFTKYLTPAQVFM